MTLAPSIASKQNTRRNSLIWYMARNVSARWDGVRRVSSENMTAISENTGDVMVEKISLRVWLNARKLPASRTSRDRRAVSRERLKFWADAGAIHSRFCQLRCCEIPLENYFT